MPAYKFLMEETVYEVLYGHGTKTYGTYYLHEPVKHNEFIEYIQGRIQMSIVWEPTRLKEVQKIT